MDTWSQGPLVLLAEDDPDIRALVSMLLRRWGYSVEAVGSGSDAIAAATERRPVLAILDVGIPPPDGIEVTRRLKVDAALRNVPILLLTAHAGELRAAEGLDAGAAGYLTKPFHAQALRKAIWSVIPAAPEHAA